MIKPVARSVTRRRALANDARKYLAAYQQLASTKANTEAMADLLQDHAVKRLLWAEAKVQQALWLQTSGRLGVKDATLMTVLREHERRGDTYRVDPTA